jgi:ribosomal protein L11 methylase PrmA
LLNEFALDLREFLQKDGRVILSGIYKDKYQEIKSLVEKGFLIERIKEDGDWKAIVLRRK